MAGSHVFEKLFECSLDGVLLTRSDGTILRANPAACLALRRSEEEIRSEGRKGLVVEDAQVHELLAVREASNEARGELIFRRPDGSTFPVEVTSGLIPSGEATPFYYVIFRDISERRRSEERLRRSNRALRMVTLCNEALVRATTEAVLFAEVCKAMVEAGGYRMCWIGLAAEDDRRTVRPVAHAGYDDGYVASLDVVWSDTARGRGPTGTAVRTGRPIIGYDFAVDPLLEPWRDAALERGYRSSTALPLVHAGVRLGAITMYSAECETFDEPELDILAQLSNDLAYGIHALRQQEARATAEEALRKSEAMLKGITDSIPEPIFLKDREGRFIFANPATLAVVGKPLDQVLGRTDAEIYGDPAIGLALAEIDRRIMESGREEVLEETVQAPDGLRVFLSTKAPFRDQDGQIAGLVGAALDITERKRAEDALRERRATLPSGVTRGRTWSVEQLFQRVRKASNSARSRARVSPSTTSIATFRKPQSPAVSTSTETRGAAPFGSARRGILGCIGARPPVPSGRCPSRRVTRARCLRLRP